MSFLDSVKRYLNDAAAGRSQKRAAWEAAVQVAEVPGGLGELLRHGFWAWLNSGRWLQVKEQRPEWRLPEGSHIAEEKIAKHYPGLRLKEAAEKATLARESRVKRSAQHLAAGWLPEDCLCFVYTREEFREAAKRADLDAKSQGSNQRPKVA